MLVFIMLNNTKIKIMEKYWNIELTSHELTIIQMAVQKYCEQYNGSVFIQSELSAVLKAVNNPIHRML
jgi:hypothetical protein